MGFPVGMFIDAMMAKFSAALLKDPTSSNEPWYEYHYLFLLRRLEEELGELREAIRDGDSQCIQEEAIDVAEFASFIWFRAVEGIESRDSGDE